MPLSENEATLRRGGQKRPRKAVNRTTFTFVLFFNALFPKAGDKLVLQALTDAKPGIVACSAHTALPCSGRFCLSKPLHMKNANLSVRNI